MTQLSLLENDELEWIEITKLPRLETLFQNCVAGYGDLESLPLEKFLKIWTSIALADYAFRWRLTLKIKGDTYANRHLLCQASGSELRDRVNAEFKRRNLETRYGVDICIPLPKK